MLLLMSPGKRPEIPDADRAGLIAEAAIALARPGGPELRLTLIRV
jgi:hypothetical protein